MEKIVKELKMTPSERITYSYLVSVAKEGENPIKTCNRELADRLMLSGRTVYTCLKKLEEHGFIEVKANRRGKVIEVK